MTTFAPPVNPAVDDLAAVLDASPMPTNPALRQAAALIRTLKLTDDVPFDPAAPKYDDFAALLDVEKAAHRVIVNARLALIDTWIAEAGSLQPVADKLGVTRQALSKMRTEARKAAETAEAEETT
ncbi:hypothetical protein [Amycolatopsis kentuckyensis]|uniref:hypothetical protein n=1 Tax=Amycolatopsis kentuckyensis TaxID=218823 RepID=UPI00356700C8